MTPAPPTSELAAFIEARLSEDEAAARAASDPAEGKWWVDGPAKVSGKFWVYATGEKFRREEVATHIARHDPTRVLAQVAALRTILRFHDDENGHDCPYLDDDGDVCTNHFVMPGETCDTLLALAAIWASDPAFDPAWSA